MVLLVIDTQKLLVDEKYLYNFRSILCVAVKKLYSPEVVDIYILNSYSKQNTVQIQSPLSQYYYCECPKRLYLSLEHILVSNQ